MAQFARGDSVTQHVLVQPGDTLETIAQSLNVGLADLMAANGIQGPNRAVLPGQELRVPSQAPAVVPTQKEPFQAPSSPMAGRVDPAWEGKLRLRDATIHDLATKASAAGLDAGTVHATLTKLATMPDRELDRWAESLRNSLTTVNPQQRFRDTLASLDAHGNAQNTGDPGAAGTSAGSAATAGGAAGAAEAGTAGASGGVSQSAGSAAGGAAAGESPGAGAAVAGGAPGAAGAGDGASAGVNQGAGSAAGGAVAGGSPAAAGAGGAGAAQNSAASGGAKAGASGEARDQVSEPVRQRRVN